MLSGRNWLCFAFFLLRPLAEGPNYPYPPRARHCKERSDVAISTPQIGRAPPSRPRAAEHPFRYLDID
jgi:hypothetical protein